MPKRRGTLHTTHREGAVRTVVGGEQGLMVHCGERARISGSLLLEMVGVLLWGGCLPAAREKVNNPPNSDAVFGGRMGQNNFVSD